MGTYCDLVKAGVQVEWKGMSDKGDYGKQVSLKPTPVRAGVRSGAGKSIGTSKDVKKEKIPISPFLARIKCGGMNHCGGVDLSSPKTNNRFSILSEIEDEVLVEEGKEEEMNLGNQGLKRSRVMSKPDNEREVKTKGEEVDEKAEDQVMEIQDSEVETEVEMAASVNLLAQVEDKEGNVATQIEQTQQLGGGQSSQLEGEALGGTVPGQVQSQAVGRSRIYPRRKGWNKGGKICSEGKENIDSEGESDEEEEDESLKTGEVLSSESAAFDFKKALETREKTQF